MLVALHAVPGSTSDAGFTAACTTAYTAAARSYNTVLNACARARDAERAEVCFQKMLDSGVRPDQVHTTLALRPGTTTLVPP